MNNKQITWTNAKRKLSELIPWTRNPRQIKVEQIERLQESLTEFGQPETIAIGPSNELYNGHQRLKSWAEKFGDIEVDVRIASRELTEKEREKLTIFLHKGAAGEWDFDTLANEFDVDDLLDWGFDKQELDLDLWGVEPEPDPGVQIDRAEELREKWGVETGQLWRLGEHRLICGDCTDAEVMARVMNGKKAQMMFTDPPYGVNYEGGHFHSGNVNIKREREKLSGDNTTEVYWKFLSIMRHLIDGPCYMFFAGSKGRAVYDAVEDNDYEIHALIIWHKINATYAAMHAQYKLRHEPIMYFKPGNSTLRWCGPTNECTLWEIRRDAINDKHPTQKPIEIVERAIRNHISDTVLDPFLGSGTTLIACERLRRKCRAVEISPAYCAVAIQRWVDLTGGKPELVNI